MAQHDKARPEPFKPGDRLSASWVQKVENFVSSFRVLSGGQFIFDGRNAVLQCFGAAASRQYALGLENYSADLGIATMREGLVTVGNVTTAINRQDIVVSGSPAYVVMRIDRRTRSAEWIGSTVSAIPQNNAQFIYVPFLEFQIPEGQTKPSLFLVHHAGSLYLP